jgi:hypothetical protein
MFVMDSSGLVHSIVSCGYSSPVEVSKCLISYISTFKDETARLPRKFGTQSLSDTASCPRTDTSALQIYKHLVYFLIPMKYYFSDIRE